jgi:hypothetical protein
MLAKTTAAVQHGCHSYAVIVYHWFQYNVLVKDPQAIALL